MIDLVRQYLEEDIEIDPVLEQKLNNLSETVDIAKGQKVVSLVPKVHLRNAARKL